MNESSLSTTMFQRVVALDREAWQHVVELYRPVIYSRCRRCGLQGDDAADVMQEIFLAAFKSIGNFRQQDPGSSFRAWLHGIAGNKLKDYWEGKAKNPPGEGGSEALRRIAQLAERVDESTTKMDADAETAGLIRRALAIIQGEFQERTWKAFWRFDIDSQSAADVAAELGITPNAVHIATCRVRKRLREEFGDLL